MPVFSARLPRPPPLPPLRPRPAHRIPSGPARRRASSPLASAMMTCESRCHPASCCMPARPQATRLRAVRIGWRHPSRRRRRRDDGVRAPLVLPGRAHGPPLAGCPCGDDSDSEASLVGARRRRHRALAMVGTGMGSGRVWLLGEARRRHSAGLLAAGGAGRVGADGCGASCGRLARRRPGRLVGVSGPRPRPSAEDWKPQALRARAERRVCERERERERERGREEVRG